MTAMVNQNVIYWMQGDAVQNFGDFMSQYLLEHLFFAQGNPGQQIRIVGSCIDDMFVPEPVPAASRTGHEPELVFWGCGLRRENGLSQDRRDCVEILAVRGPLSRSALRLGSTVPIGDPGLLLPALHKAASAVRRPTHRTLLIPHFHDRRADAELLAISGCEAVLRPNIPNDLSAITEFIDAVVASAFVLSASLHGAIVAAAYGKPFAYWDSGDIDLPFKWADFSASLSIPCVFHTTLEGARAHYTAEVRDAVRIPVLWPLLVASPMPVRPDAFISVIEQDVQRHGLHALEASASSWAANRLQARLELLLEGAQQSVVLQSELAASKQRQDGLQQHLHERLEAERRKFALERQSHDAGRRLAEAAVAEANAREAGSRDALIEAERVLRDVATQRDAQTVRLKAAEQAAADLLADRERLAAELAERDQARQRSLQQYQAGQDVLLTERQALEMRLDKAVAREGQTRGELEGEVNRLSAREAWLAAEEARLHREIQHRDRANEGLVAELGRLSAQLHAMQRTLLWRLGGPARRLARLRGFTEVRPGLGRLLKLVWWTASLQLPSRLARRRRTLQEIASIAASPLFEHLGYQAAQPGAGGTRHDAARHYVFVGCFADAAPNHLFDSAWYRATYAGAWAGYQTPFGHFLSTGAAMGYDPHPLFDTAWYVAENPDAGGAGDALLHYLRQGAAGNAAPNRLFNPAGYLSEYKDARQSGLDAFSHYVSYGAKAGYDPHEFFDTAYYVSVAPEQRHSGLEPLAHYLRVGARQGTPCTPLIAGVAGFSADRELELPEFTDPEASVVIPAYGHYFQTVRCLHALMAHSTGAVSFETLLIDDDPANSLAGLLSDVRGLRLVQNPTNLGFLRSCNRAASLAHGWHLIFLNNDTLVQPGWIEPLLHLVRADATIGMVGCKLLNADGTLQEAGGILFDDGWGHSFGKGDDSAKPEYNYLRDVDVVVGAAFLVRRELFAALRGFDDRYAPAFYEEFDLAFEVRRAGYRVVYQPKSVVVHFGSTSYGPELRDRQSRYNHAQFCLKWEAALPLQPGREEGAFIARQRNARLGAILMIDDKVPEYDRHAGALTTFQYMELLTGLGFRIIYWPADGVAREPYTSRLQSMGVEILSAPASLSAWLHANGRHLTAIWAARPDVTAPLLDLLRRAGVQLLYYPHDIHHVRGLRQYRLDGNLDALVESNRVRKLELAIFQQASVVMTPSEDDAAIVMKLAPCASVTVIPPYIYARGATSPLTVADFDARADILFVGGFKHPPNVDAALWLIRDIMPIVWQSCPKAHVLLVGDEPTREVRDLASDHVTVTGHVPVLSPWLARARLSIAPLRYGSGVKGKIVTCLQAGIPVVTTGIGNEGINLQNGKEALLGETAEVLAAHITSLLDDRATCAALSKAGHLVIADRFSIARARSTILSVLGIRLCRVCGVRRGPQPSAPECAACGAALADEAVAEAILAALGADEAACLAAAVPVFARRRIHTIGISPAISLLRDAQLLTSADPGTPTQLAMTSCFAANEVQDEELDLVVCALDLGDDLAGGHWPEAFGLLFRALRASGQFILSPTGRPMDTIIASALKVGFAVVPPHGPDYVGSAIALRKPDLTRAGP